MLSRYSGMTENFAKIEKYNFWSNEFPNVGFIRSHYLNKIDAFIGK